MNRHVELTVSLWVRRQSGGLWQSPHRPCDTFTNKTSMSSDDKQDVGRKMCEKQNVESKDAVKEKQ